MSLRAVFTPPQDGPTNMATDVALLRSVAAGRSRPTLRLYRWKGPWVSLGYAQDAARAVDLAACEAAGVGLVRRPTGGKALLHGSDLTYCLTLPGSHPVAHASIGRSYLAISKVLVDALALLGLEGSLTERESGRSDATRACFEEHRVETVSLGGRKLIGSAQARRDGGLLQHGSILLSPNDELAARLFRPQGLAVEEFRERYRGRVVSLAEAAPAVTAEALAAALVAAFGKAFGDVVAGDLAADELLAVEELKKTEFLDIER